MDELLDHRTKIDPLECRAGKLGVRAGCLADVADQAIQASDILANNGLEPFAKLGVFDAVQAIHGGPKRSEGILELMSHVCGKGFDIVDAVPKGLAHVGKGACQQADLVAS